MAGNLDISFGDAGIRSDIDTFNVSSEENTSEVVADKQGRAVLAATLINGHGSSILLARFNPDGSYDKSFGKAGIAIAPLNSLGDTVTDLDVQSDGKIVVVCNLRAKDLNSSGNFALYRFTAAGTLDSSFGDGGMIRHQYFPPNHVGAFAMSIGLQDEIYVLFSNITDTASILKCRPNGFLDPTFANGGRLDMSMTQNWGGDLVMRADGSLIVATSYIADQFSEPAIKVQRIFPNGTIDAFFGGGSVNTRPGFASFVPREPIRMVIDSNQEFYIGSARSHASTNSYFLGVTKFDSNGNRKQNFEFGSDGDSFFFLSSRLPKFTDLDVLPNGELALAYIDSSFSSLNVIPKYIRLGQDGLMRRDLGNAGIQEFGTMVPGGIIQSVAMQDGSLLSFYHDTESERDIFVRRFHPSGEYDFDTFNRISASESWGKAEGKSVAEVSGGKVLTTYVTTPPKRNFSTPIGPSIVLSRLTSDGNLDSTFELSGKFTWATNDVLQVAESWFVKRGSNLFWVVQRDADVSITKLKSDGAFDRSYGKSGWITWSRPDISPGSQITPVDSIVPLDDGFLVSMTALDQSPEGSRYVYTIAKLDTAGALVSAFGTNGLLRIPTLGPYFGSSSSLAVQSTGKILVFQSNTQDTGAFATAIKRYDQLGRFDALFGFDGIVIVGRVGSLNSAVPKIALQPDDGILVLTDLSSDPQNPLNSVTRLNSNGTFDLSYGPNSSGSIVLPTQGKSVVPISITIDSQKRALVTAKASDTYHLDSMVYRITPQGTMDRTFGNDGVVELNLSSFDDELTQITTTSSGGILAAGYRQTTDQTQAVYVKLVGRNSAWQNPGQIHDVDNNQSVDPLDVLALINYINSFGSHVLPSDRPTNSPDGYLDVDGDQSISPLDVLRVINEINSKGNGEGEATSIRCVDEEWHSLFWATYTDEAIELQNSFESKKSRKRF